MSHTKGQTFNSIYEVPRMARIMRTGRKQVTCNCKDGNTRLLSPQFQLLEIDSGRFHNHASYTYALYILQWLQNLQWKLKRWLSGQCCLCMRTWVWIPRTHIKKPDMIGHICNPSGRGGNRRIPVAHWPASLAIWWTLSLVKDPVSKNVLLLQWTKFWFPAPTW